MNRLAALFALSTVFAALAQETPTDVTPKAFGDLTRDQVFTPLPPCRVVDTRLAGGSWAPGVTRTYSGFTAGNFTAQGGASSNCGIPNGVSALAIEALALNPPADGWFFLWPGNITHPATSTFNYGPALSVVTFGTILPVDPLNNNQFKADSSQGANLIIDVVGYFSVAPLVQTTDLATSAVTAAKLASGSLPAAYFAFTASNSAIVPFSQFVTLTTANCAAGTAISGSCSSNDSATFLVASYSNGPSWSCTFSNRGGTASTAVVQALCLSTPAATK